MPCLIHRDLSLSQWVSSRFSCCASWPHPCPSLLGAGGSWGGSPMNSRLGGAPPAPQTRPNPPEVAPSHPVVLATGEDAAEPGLACPLLPRECPLAPLLDHSRCFSQPGSEGKPGEVSPPHCHAAHRVFGGICVPLSCPAEEQTRLIQRPRRAGQFSAVPTLGIYFLSLCPTFRAVPCPFSGLALLLCFCRATEIAREVLK